MEGETSITVASFLRFMLPDGTAEDPADNPTWDEPPFWPPDAFAVAAALVDRSGCYSYLDPGMGEREFFEVSGPANQQRIRNVARFWASEELFDALVSDDSEELDTIRGLWTALLTCEDPLVSEIIDFDLDEEYPMWWRAAVQLLVIADEASAGFGFSLTDNGDDSSWIRTYAALRFTGVNASSDGGQDNGEESSILTESFAPHTFCLRVPPDLATVLPKAMTPNVGCSIRSLSHHLALLPGFGEVTAHWNQLATDRPNRSDEVRKFNLLVIPLPYRVTAKCFRRHEQHGRITGAWGWFDVWQSWLPSVNSALPFNTNKVADFVIELIGEAMDEVGSVDGVVFPELALDSETFKVIEQKLNGKIGNNGVGFLIAGIKTRDDRNYPRNIAATTVYDYKRDDGVFVYRSYQSKHHRWKLNRSQIVQYSLGDALDPNLQWWEGISVNARQLYFHEFCAGGCFTTLICEDLARVDPCQKVIRSVGPNLVIALLMDGPQLRERWPAKHATVLAEDPGSSVLTVTSAGLTSRTSNTGLPISRNIAMWKDATGGIREISMPTGFHAICLTLTGESRQEYSIDGRSDEGFSSHWSLSGIAPISHPQPSAYGSWAKW